MTNLIQTIGAWSISVISTGGYAGLFLLSFLENLCVPIPSEIVMPFSGYLVLTGQFNMVWVLAVATIANLLGSIVIYVLARVGGRPLLERYGKYIFIRLRELDKWDSWFMRHGPATVFWLRFVPTGRVLVSIPAGVAKMGFKKFLVYTFAGSLLWNVILTYIGYAAGQHWDVLHVYFQKFDIVLVMIVVAVIVWWIVRHFKHRS